MIIKKQAYFTSDNRISKIRTLLWEHDENQASGVVQIIPSFGDHIDRYDAFARFLCQNGYVVCGADHIGHGGSVDTPEELGAVTPDAHLTVIRDANTLHRIMSKRYPDTPYYILGVGIGAFAARIYAGAFSDLLTGAVFVGCGQLPDFVWAFTDPLNALMDRLPRELSAAAAPDVLFGKLTKRVYKDNSELSWLSRSEETLEDYIADPYTGFTMTKELTAAMMQLMLKGSDRRNADVLPPDFKIMFVSGAKDSLGFLGRGVISASDLYAAAGITPEVILYPMDRHDILHEPDQDRVYADILKFLNLKDNSVY